MNSNQLSTGPSHPKSLLLTIAGLAFLGFADATYLTVEHFLTFPLPCYITQGCDAVLKSKYAVVGPIPIALLGALYYLTIMILAAHFVHSGKPKGAHKAILGLTCAGVGFSAVLVYLQVFVIHALCMYCLISAGLSLFLFICALILFKKLEKKDAAVLL